MIDPILEIVKSDPRYKADAYDFVRRALAYAQDELMMEGEAFVAESGSESEKEAEDVEHHLTGQQLCEAIRRYAVEQFGYMATIVLRNWGVTSTSDFGEIVYNMIRFKQMRKSPQDRREHFDDVFDFEEAFQKDFRIGPPPP